EGLSKDFCKTYLERLDAVTIADVQRAAQKHFSTSNARIVVTGKASEVLENLERVSFKGKPVPVLHFDTYADKTERPVLELAMPEGVTLASVLGDYIKAIGGKEKLEAVTSSMLTAEATIQGMTMELVQKKTDKTQFLQDLIVMGNSMQKQVLNGDKGYKVIQGQRMDLTPEEVAKVQAESA